jgi:hypothetical protein
MNKNYNLQFYQRQANQIFLFLIYFKNNQYYVLEILFILMKEFKLYGY